jgi:VanZ family protein
LVGLIGSKSNKQIWAILTLVMVSLILYFGLRIRGRGDTNDVDWLPDQGALRFEGSGIAYVDDLPNVRLENKAEPLTIEVVVTPGGDPRQGGSPLLLLHDGADQRQLCIWQYADSLIAMNGDDYSNARRWPRITGRHVLRADRICYLTITASAKEGTRLYVDGGLIAEKKDWCLRFPLEGQPLRLVLGNSVYGRHGWDGDFHGVAITVDALSAARIKQRYERWRVNRYFFPMEHDLPILFFAFDQRSWAHLLDHGGGGPLLEIPHHVIVLKRKILALPQFYFRLNRAAVVDMVLNVMGFVPLGAILFGYLQSFKGFGNHHKWIAVASCGILSLGIELAQAWIPTRYSTLLDLVLNIGGAWIGVEMMALFRRFLHKSGKIVPSM